MKTSTKFFALLLSALAFAGCSSCPCEKNAEKAKAAAPAKTVVAPVVAPVAQQVAPVVPVAPVKPVVKKIPDAVLK